MNAAKDAKKYHKDELNTLFKPVEQKVSKGDMLECFWPAVN
jgi:hypothetical protein